MNDEREDRLLADVRKISEWADGQKKIQKWVLLFLPIFILFGGFLSYREHKKRMETVQMPEQDSCRAIENAMDEFKYDKAAGMAQRLSIKYPNDTCGFYYLGRVSLVTGHLKEAEKNYLRTYELFPSENSEKTLQALRKRMRAEGAGSPAAPRRD